MSSTPNLSLFADPAAGDAAANILAAARALAAHLARSRPLDRKLVAAIMTTAFGGSDAEGVWAWRDAYDAIEAATVLQVRRLAPQVGRLEDAPAEITALLTALTHETVTSVPSAAPTIAASTAPPAISSRSIRRRRRSGSSTPSDRMPADPRRVRRILRPVRPTYSPASWG